MYIVIYIQKYLLVVTPLPEFVLGRGSIHVFALFLIQFILMSIKRVEIELRSECSTEHKI